MGVLLDRQQWDRAPAVTKRVGGPAKIRLVVCSAVRIDGTTLVRFERNLQGPDHLMRVRRTRQD